MASVVELLRHNTAIEFHLKLNKFCHTSIFGVCFYLRSKRSDEIEGKGDLYAQQRQIESDFWVPSFTTGQYARFFFLHKVETFFISNLFDSYR